MKRILYFFTLALIGIPILTIYSDELKFGSMGAGTYGRDDTEIMHDTLGFNIYILHPDNCVGTEPYSDEGIVPVSKGNGNPYEWINILTNYNYALIEAEDRDQQMDLYEKYGRHIQAGYWISDYDTNTLFGPSGWIPGYEGSPPYVINWLRMYTDSLAYPSPKDSLIKYTIAIKANIDSVGATDVAVATLGMAYGRYPTEIHFVDSLWASQFDTTGEDRVITFGPVILPESTQVEDTSGAPIYVHGKNSYTTAIVLTATGIRKLSVDWVKIYDEHGIQLVENNDYNDRIVAHCDTFSGCVNELWGFYSKDEPVALQFRPAGKVLEVMHAAHDSRYANWNIITPVTQRNATNYWFEVCDNGLIASDYYPFLYYDLANYPNDSTEYTGFDSDRSANQTIQASLNNCGDWYEDYKNSADAVGAEF